MNLEHRIQSALVAAGRNIRGAEKLFAIPNGGNRSAITGAILRREGVLPGVPDLFLPVARGGFHGLFIEVKTPGGKIQASQQNMMKYLEEQIYCVRIARTAQRGLDIIQWYLGLER